MNNKSYFDKDTGLGVEMKKKTSLVHPNLSLDTDSSMLSVTENNVTSANNLPSACKL